MSEYYQPDEFEVGDPADGLTIDQPSDQAKPTTEVPTKYPPGSFMQRDLEYLLNKGKDREERD